MVAARSLVALARDTTFRFSVSMAHNTSNGYHGLRLQTIAEKVGEALEEVVELGIAARERGATPQQLEAVFCDWVYGKARAVHSCWNPENSIVMLSSALQCRPIVICEPKVGRARLWLRSVRTRRYGLRRTWGQSGTCTSLPPIETSASTSKAV